MKKIRLRNGEYAKVDNEDYPYLAMFTWCKTGRYVRCYHKNKRTAMHHVILWKPLGNNLVIDHINGDTLDNRRANLRVCTQSCNVQNRRRASRYKSNFLGVSRIKRRGTWRATITHEKDSFYLGSFRTEIDAAKRYDEAAKLLYGKMARVNFPNKK